MKDYRLSGDARFDDARYWRFERRSGLPRGYFDSPYDRLGARLLSIVMWGAAFFIVFGLAFGWFA